MRQLNLNLTPDIERDLQEAVTKASTASASDYGSWLGLGQKVPLNPMLRFRGEDDLWS